MKLFSRPTSASIPWRLAALALGWIQIAAAHADPPAAPAARDKKPAIRVTISKETTWITEPLREDGYPDYLAWLNRKYSQGVTPENNAVVLLWQIVGPGEVPKAIRDEYFRKLGVAAPPEGGEYFVRQDVYREKHNKRAQDYDAKKRFRQQWRQAGSRPWSAKEFPELGAWLAANDRFLDRAVEMSQRPRCFSPLVGQSESPPLLNSFGVLGALTSLYRINNGLCMRAMFRLQNGDVERACDDLAAVARMAKLFSERGSDVESQLAAVAVAGMVSPLTSLVHSDQLTAKQAAEFRRQLHDAMPRLDYIGRIDEWHRIVMLDMVCSSAADEGAQMAKVNSGQQGPAPGAESMVDWDVVLKHGNTTLDAFVAAAKSDDLEKSRKAIRKFSNAQYAFDKKSKETAFGWPALAALGGQPGRELVSKNIAMKLINAAVFSPDLMMFIQHRTQTMARMNEVVLALAAYRGDKRAFPERLDQVVPDYIEVLPRDAYANTPFRYDRTATGFRLYSLGSDGDDDGGQHYDFGGTRGQDDDLVTVPPQLIKSE